MFFRRWNQVLEYLVISMSERHDLKKQGSRKCGIMFCVHNKRINILKSVNMSCKKSEFQLLQPWICISLWCLLEFWYLLYLPFTRVKLFNEAQLRSTPFVMFCFRQKLGFPLYPFILLLIYSPYSLLKYKNNHEYRIKCYVIQQSVRLIFHRLA